jgi:uncharacterized membrane protein
MLEFLWKYIAGPIVAEAIGEPAVWRGVEAVAGYNIFNTVAWAVLGILSILAIQRFLENKGIELDPDKAFKLLPLIILAGILRFTQDAIDLPLIIEILLITPIIYVWIAVVAVTFLYLEDRRGISRYFTGLNAISSVALLYFLPAINLLPVIAVILGASICAGIYYYIFQGQKFAETPLVLAVGSQFFEAFSSMFAVSQGFEARQILTSTAVDLAGPLGFLLVKLGLLYLALSIYFDLDERWKSILLIALYSIGFGTGIRVLLRVATGV